MRAGKPHWAYSNMEMVSLTENRDAIQWTPNTIASEVKIERNRVKIKLTSDTANFKEYQMRELPSDEWDIINKDIVLELTGKNTSTFFAGLIWLTFRNQTIKL